MQLGLMGGMDYCRTYADALETARLADRLGFAAYSRGDHLLGVDGNLDAPMTEAYVTLAGIARETHRVRFGAVVSPATFRHPVLFARQIATLDEMSGGRVFAGLGAGWYEPEHEPLGIPFDAAPDRFDRLEEQLAVVRGLFTGASLDFVGRYYRLAGARLSANLVQRPHPPIVLGGTRARTVRLAARFGDELNIDQLEPADTVRLYELLDRELEAVGRPRAAVVRSNVVAFPTGDPDAIAGRLAAFEQAGVELLYLKRPAGQPSRDVEAFARTFIGA